MKIYISHPRSYDYENELYEPLRRHFSGSGHEFVLPHEHGGDADTKSVIRSCDLLIAEVSLPATGVGIELGRAEAAGIPIVCIHKKDAVPSGSLRHVCSDFYVYDSTENLHTVFERIAGGRTETPSEISA